MSTKKKIPRKTSATPRLVELFDPSKIVIVAGKSGCDGMPDAEYGPKATSFRNPSGLPYQTHEVLNEAAGLRHDLARAVFVLTDARLNEHDRGLAAIAGARAAGSFTDCLRLVAKVRWVPYCWDVPVETAAAMAARELEIAYDEDPSLTRSDVMFVIWKRSAAAFNGASSMRLAQAVIDLAFTSRDVKWAADAKERSLLSDDDDECSVR